MRLALSGYYGSGNLGDEAILEVLLEQIRHFSTLSGQASTRILVLGVPSARPPKVLKRFAGQPDFAVEFLPWAGLLRQHQAIKSCSYFIGGGGGIFQDQTSGSSFWFYLLQLASAQLAGLKTILLAQSFGPLNLFHRLALRPLLRKADLVTVRSDRSFDFCRRLGAGRNLYRTADLAFLLEPGGPAAEQKGGQKGGRSSDGKTLGVVLKNAGGREAGAVLGKLRQKIKQLSARDGIARIIFIPFQPERDLALNQKAALTIASLAGIPTEVLEEGLAPPKALFFFRQLDLVLSARYHGLVLAALAGVPAEALSEEEKLSDLAAELGPGTGQKADLNRLKELAQKNLYYLSRLLGWQTVRILGVPITTRKREDILDFCEAVIESGGPADKKAQPAIILSGNPELLVRAKKEPGLMSCLDRAALIIPDGVGLIWAARRLSLPLTERIAGIELTPALLLRAARRGWKIFLLGGRPGAAKEAAEHWRKKYPCLMIVGTRPGYFTEGEEDKIAEEIKASRAQIVLAGLGMPRQEIWLDKNLARTGARLGLAVGGSFDVWSGQLKRAPALLRRRGLEWFWRLITQPTRWRRMLALLEFYRLVRRSGTGSSGS